MFKRFAGYRFKPKLFPTIVTLLLLPVLIFLGFWQLHRADFKQQLQAQFDQRQQAKPLSLNDISHRAANDLMYYPIQVAGKFDTAHPLLLDNKMYQHRPGYQVLMPFFPAGSSASKPEAAILVNLGWIPQGMRRDTLPGITINPGVLVLRGAIYLPATKSFSLGQMVESDDTNWPKRIERIELKQLSEKLGYPLQPFVVLLAPDMPYGYVREWSPVELKVAMHKGYAVQWFALAVTLLIIYFFVNLRRQQERQSND